MVDLRQNTLFGEKIISSIDFDEQNIIRDILHLHGNGNYIDVDPCFSIGNFYKQGLPEPRYKFDKTPRRKDVVEATSDNLPLIKESVNVVMFDPPFLMGGQNYEDNADGSSIIPKRFTMFKDWAELCGMYTSSLIEFHRILKKDGIVIFKCQDTVSGGKNHFTHNWVFNKAIELGYYPKDLFILLAKNRITDARKQQHARKYHSYFWVLQKQACKIKY